MTSPQRNQIRIRDGGRLLLLDYQNFLAYHGGGALAGAAIGFRAMQYTGSVLSQHEVWDRNDLSVTTRHSGPGIRDAIEYVTRCVTRGRFKLDEQDRSGGALDAFQFTVTDGRQQVRIALRPGVVPQRFFDLAHCLRENHRTDRETARTREELDALKAAVAPTVMAKSLDELFAAVPVAEQNAIHA